MKAMTTNGDTSNHNKDLMLVITPNKFMQHNTWIKGSGLDKRKTSLEVIFRAEEQQPDVTIIFRGSGKAVTNKKNLALHPGADIFFQKNTSMEIDLFMD